MAKKRAHNEGSIYQDSNGVWWAQLPADDAGKRPKRRAKSKDDARIKLRQLHKDRESGINPGIKNPTLETHIKNWLELVIRKPGKENTYNTYSNYARLYIYPELGDIRLDKLTPARIQAWINGLQQRVSNQTVGNAYRRLRTALGVAVDWDLIPRNPASKVKVPRVSNAAIRPLDADQVGKLLEVISGHRNAALYEVALLLGLREGELIGLRWSDVNLDKQTIKICSQIQHIKGEAIRTSVKTERSNRQLPLPPHLVLTLRMHLKNQREEIALLGDEWQDHGLVFPSERGTPLMARNLVRQFKGFLSKAELPMTTRFHDCRHTAASLMLARGVPTKTVSDILGHSSIKVTADTYGFSFDDDKARALATLATVYGRTA